jgi:hypothetical protein
MIADRLDEVLLSPRFTAEPEEAPALRAFLAANPDLLDVLAAAGPHLDAAFGPGRTAALDLIADPEADETPELWARVAVPAETGVGGALDRLAAFRAGDWWRATRPRVRGRLGFDVRVVG